MRTAPPGKAIRDRPRGLQRKARLADAARADERDQSHVGAHQQLADLGQLAAAADRLVGGRGQRGREPSAGTFGRQLRIVREDHALQPPQLRPRLDPELVHQQPAARAHRLERLRLPAGPIQRQHQLRAQALAQRVLGDQRRPAHRPGPRRARMPGRPPSAPRSPPPAAPPGGRSRAARTRRSDDRPAPPLATAPTPPAGRRRRALDPRDQARLARGRADPRNGGSRSPTGRSPRRSPPADGAPAILHPAAGADARSASAAPAPRPAGELVAPQGLRAARRPRPPQARAAQAARTACVA